MNQNNILSALASVCRSFYGRSADFDREEFAYSFAPAAGLLPGLLMTVISASFVLFMGRVGGGIMTAIFIPLAFEILVGWRGISVSVAFIDRLVSGKNNGQGEAQQTTDLMQRQILFASFYLFRMAAFGLLAASGNAIWIVYVLGGSYLIRGELLRSESDSFDNSRFGGWFFYIIFAVFAGLLALNWTALGSLPLAIILTALLLFGSRRIIEKFFGRTEFWMADFMGYLSENLMFIVGLILFGRQIYG